MLPLPRSLHATVALVVRGISICRSRSNPTMLPLLVLVLPPVRLWGEGECIVGAVARGKVKLED